MFFPKLNAIIRFWGFLYFISSSSSNVSVALILILASKTTIKSNKHNLIVIDLFRIERNWIFLILNKEKQGSKCSFGHLIWLKIKG